MKFLRSVTDMKCKCFSDSQAKLLEGSDSGCWGGIRMTLILFCACGLLVVIG
jgi:hypothetical protein